MSKQGFEFNGNVATSIKELSDMIGRKVTKKEVLAGEVDGVSVIDLDTNTELPEEQVEVLQGVETTLQDAVDQGELTEEEAESISEDMAENLNESDQSTAEDMAREDEADTEDDNTPDPTPEPEHKPTLDELRARLKVINEQNKANNPSGNGKKGSVEKLTGEIEYPERGTVKSEKDLKKFYKKLTDEQLDDWLSLEGLTDKVKLCDHEAINRMRKCMAITDYHFPKQSAGSSKKKSKYADYTTEELVSMALENNIPIKDDKGDARILRMYTIMALREAKVLD